jgi:hypothetical protein
VITLVAGAIGVIAMLYLWDLLEDRGLIPHGL